MSDIIELSDLKDWLGITSTTDDPKLERLITSVSNEVFSQTGRPSAGFIEQTDIVGERRDGTGTDSICPLDFPINSVSSVIVDGVSISPSPDGILPGYVFSQTKISLVGYSGGAGARNVPNIGSIFNFRRGRGNVYLSYNAGYDGAPEDLQQDVIEICALKYQSRKRIGLESNSSKSGESSRFNEAQQIEAKWKSIRARYKSWGIR